MHQGIEHKIKHTLKLLSLEQLKPMQEKAIDTILEKEKVVVLSPTGSGKTLAFLLPFLELLQHDKQGVQTIIIAPSRELVQQIERVFRSLQSGFKIVCCYGGHSLRLERQQLEVAPAVLVATPGRLLDHIRHERIDLTSVNYLVLDEFDKCLELGFTEEMQAIIELLPHLKRRILTSATHAPIPAYTSMEDATTLDFLADAPKPQLSIYQYPCYQPDKLEPLLQLLCNSGLGRKIIFCNYRESIERVSRFLFSHDIDHSIFHGGMEQAERERSLVKFRNGSTDIILSTDLAARGLDVPEVGYIIHYHLPLSEDSYIHRNGRSARMGNKGSVILMIGSEEFLPEFISEQLPHYNVSTDHNNYPQTLWQTLYIGKGKRDKINKIDIVGFLIQQGELEKSEIGEIELKEQHAYVSIPRAKAKAIIKKIKPLKIKKQKCKFELCY